MAISSTIDRTDAVVGIFSNKSGAWAERELAKAIDKDVSIVPVTVGADARIPSRLRKVESLHIEEAGDVDSTVAQIVSKLR